MEYSIVTPAYNESDKISTTVTQMLSFMRSFSDCFEIIIVDDGSTDSTADVVSEICKENKEVKIIRNPHKGKGFAVWTGMHLAKGELIYMADADLSAPISELKKLTMWIKEQDFDIVIASREGVGANRVGEPLHRHLMGRVFNILVQIIALPGISDSQCGFKLFTKESARDIFSRLKIYGEGSKELKKPFLGAWDVEVLYLARKLGYTIKQVPVTWTYVKSTRIHPIRDSLRMGIDVFKIRINYLLGKYNSAQKASPKKS